MQTFRVWLLATRSSTSPARAAPGPMASTATQTGTSASSSACTTGSTAGSTTACTAARTSADRRRSEEHTSELQSQSNLVCRLLLEKKKKTARNKTEYRQKDS